MVSPVSRKDAAPLPLRSTSALLREWAFRPSAEQDLEDIFGPCLDWSAAYRLLQAFRSGDDSVLPPIAVLAPRDMPGLWGGYSRDLNRIFLSSDLPAGEFHAVLLEEIGHFLDTALCATETPGDEGAVFANLVLGDSVRPTEDLPDEASCGHLGSLCIPVEAARKTKKWKSARKNGSRKNGRRKTSDKRLGMSEGGSSAASADTGYAGEFSPNPRIEGGTVFAKRDSVVIEQRNLGDRLIGSPGNDTFSVFSQNVTIEDFGGTDTVLTRAYYTLEKNTSIENLTAATGAGNIALTGNSKANLIVGNEGNNLIDGGLDSAVDTLVGGAGNDSYLLRNALDLVVEQRGGGIDTILTPINNASLSGFSADHVENLAFVGEGAATLSGNASGNMLIGGIGDDVLFGGGGDTLVGGKGDDFYYVRNATDSVLEGNDVPDGVDTISTAFANYSMEDAANVEVLEYTGVTSSNLTANSSDNTVHGGLFVRNTIRGGTGDDYLIGGDTTDSLVGGEGNDTLVVTHWANSSAGLLGASLRPGVGSDILNGGSGDDWYVVNSQSSYTFIDFFGTNTVASTVDYSLLYNSNISSSIQNLYLVGNANLRGTGSERANILTGNDGNNSISGGRGNDTFYGGLGADLLNGEQGSDTLYGGGYPQTDLPEDASTPVLLSAGQTFRGVFEKRWDQDWVKVVFNEGETYKLSLSADLKGSEIFKQNSWIYLGDPLRADGSFAYGAYNYLNGSFLDENFWTESWWSANYDGYDGGRYLAEYEFTAFDSGEFFIPVENGGPSTGSYLLTLQSLSSPEENLISLALADDGSNTLVGGLGDDYLVAGNGRDAEGNPIGDFLLGGTNGIPGQVDTDSANDTLIGGDGNDILDGGRGDDSQIGGKGNDTYYLDNPADKVLENEDGGADDLLVIGFLQSGGNVALGLFDVDLQNRYTHIEHASLRGNANLSAVGNAEGNSLMGNTGNNTLVGRGGNDSLLGFAGNNSLEGGDGADYLDGGITGTNSLAGGIGSDTYVINNNRERILGEISGIDGGIDEVRTHVNFDPLQSTLFDQFSPYLEDGSPAVNKSPSFASADLEIFYNLENFRLLGGAAYAVGNALDNAFQVGPVLEDGELASDSPSVRIYGQGGNDTLIGGNGNDTLYGDSSKFYASPDLYASAPFDTRTSEFLRNIMGDNSGGSPSHWKAARGNDYLAGGNGNDYLDGGASFDTMIGGDGNDTFVVNHVDDYIDATGGGTNALYSSVDVPLAPDGISELTLVVTKQDADSGQSHVARLASFGTGSPSYVSNVALNLGNWLVINRSDIAELQVHYGVADGAILQGTELDPANFTKVVPIPDPSGDPFKKAVVLSWDAQAAIGDPLNSVLGYVVEYREDVFSPWLTYVKGNSQDFTGTAQNPVIQVTGLDNSKSYEFRVTTQEFVLPVRELSNGGREHQVVTLIGGVGDEVVSSARLTENLPGDLVDDALLDPFLLNDPFNSRTPGSILTPAPGVNPTHRFAAYMEGGTGNDLLYAARVNGGLGSNYTLRGVEFQGLNTMVGGQGSDTFVVNNGGRTMGAEFDHVVKFGNETPQNFGAGGVGDSLNGGRHNLVISTTPFTTLSDTIVSQGRFIDQLTTIGYARFGRGNRLDNYIEGRGGLSTLVGAMGRDSLVVAPDVGRDFQGSFLLVGGTAHGVDNVGLALAALNGNQFRADVSFNATMPNPLDLFVIQVDSANGLFVGQVLRGANLPSDTTITRINGNLVSLNRAMLSVLPGSDSFSSDNKATYQRYRDLDPVDPNASGPGLADPSQYWLVETPQGEVFDPYRNSDTLRAHPGSVANTLDGGAGHDYLVGSSASDRFDIGDTFYVSASSFVNSIYPGSNGLIFGGTNSHRLDLGDAVFGNGGNDTIVFTDSDNFWSGKPGATTAIHGYSISRWPGQSDISNLILGPGSPTARIAVGNFDSTGVPERGTGSNWLVGNEFSNTLDGGGVGGTQGKGEGIDTLTGGAGSDFFAARGYTASESNEWNISVTVPDTGPNAGLFVFNSKESTYTDSDYVLITDFEQLDQIGLNRPPSEFWIGRAPGKSGLESNNVRPGVTDPTNFGIYRASSPGDSGPNLVAHVQTSGFLTPGGFGLSPADLSPANHAFAPNMASVSANQAYLGWGEFYRLDGSSISANIVTI